MDKILSSSPKILMGELLRELGIEEDIIEEEMSKDRVVTRDNLKALIVESMFR